MERDGSLQAIDPGWTGEERDIFAWRPGPDSATVAVAAAPGAVEVAPALSPDGACSKDSSRPATGSTAIHSPFRTASADISSHARVSMAHGSLIPSVSSLASSASSACPTGSGPTTASPSPPPLSADSPDSPYGGSSSASCPISSSPPHLNRTVVTSECTEPSRLRPPSHLLVTGPLSNVASTSSAPTSTTSDRTKHSANVLPLLPTSPRPDPSPPNSLPSTTPPTSKSEKSLTTGAFVGTPLGSTSLTCLAGSGSVSTRSPMASGPSTSAPSPSAGYT